MALSHASVPPVTDILLSMETIHCYDPYLASVFMYLGCSGFDSLEIAAFLKNFDLERPLQSQEISQLSLLLFFSFLKCVPFLSLLEVASL